MKISDMGIAVIKGAEGLRLQAYRCPAGILTIGYGHTGPDVTEGMEISEEEAEALLRKDVAAFESCVGDIVTVPLSQGQFDACVSLAFNIGCKAFANSTLVRLLNVGDTLHAANEFKRWNKAAGRELPGLSRRREAERRLFVA